MPRPSCSRSPDPLRPGDLIDLLAERLVEAHLAGAGPGPALVRVRPTDDGVDLGLWALPAGTNPVDALIGTTVGPRWSAVGVVTEGSARSLDHDLDAGLGDESRGSPVVVAVLVDRYGHVAHRVAARDRSRSPRTTGAPEGRVVDGLRRALGLPTPPPSTASGPWWATLWLDRIVADVATEPASRRTLLALAELHPLVGSGLAPRDATVLHRIEPGPSLAGWETMRCALASTDTAARSSEHAIRQALLPVVSPAQARWFDQGSFARWLEASLPPRPVLLAATDALLAPRLAQALREAVAE